MKKINKIVLALVVLSCTAFSLSAQSIVSEKRPVSSTAKPVATETERFSPASAKTAENSASETVVKNCKVLIGRLEEIDSSSDCIAVRNADNTIVWVRMSPFTTHYYTEYMSDLRLGDWLKIELFNTDTSVLEADTINAYRPPKKQSSKKYIPAPDPLAK